MVHLRCRVHGEVCSESELPGGFWYEEERGGSLGGGGEGGLAPGERRAWGCSFVSGLLEGEPGALGRRGCEKWELRRG